MSERYPINHVYVDSPESWCGYIGADGVRCEHRDKWHPPQEVFDAWVERSQAVAAAVIREAVLVESVIQEWPAGGFWCLVCRSRLKERSPHAECPFGEALSARGGE